MSLQGHIYRRARGERSEVGPESGVVRGRGRVRGRAAARGAAHWMYSLGVAQKGCSFGPIHAKKDLVHLPSSSGKTDR